MKATVEKPWGSYTVFSRKPSYLIKRLDVHSRSRLSLQKHMHRTELWIVLSGSATVTIGDKTALLEPGETVFIPKETFHRIENKEEAPLEILEVQRGEILDEEDIVRIEDDYGRA